jgi:hypothetical protein
MGDRVHDVVGTRLQHAPTGALAPGLALVPASDTTTSLPDSPGKRVDRDAASRRLEDARGGVTIGSWRGGA